MESKGKILLVGGAGYIGSVLSTKLISRGYSLNILDKMWFGRSGIDYVNSYVQFHDFKDINIYESDMRVPPEKCFENVDVVVNLGGMSNDPTSEYNPKFAYELNTESSISIAKKAKSYGIDRYVFASTCSIYSGSNDINHHDNVYTEEEEVSPKYTYSKSKLDAEEGLLLIGEGFCPTILRKGTAFGLSPRMRFDLVVNAMYRSAKKDKVINVFHGGQMWRPLVSVEDISEAYIKVIESDTSVVKNKIYNISSDNLKISDIATTIADAMNDVCGFKPEVVLNNSGDGNIRSYQVSTKKIEKELGFFSQSLNDSIKIEIKKFEEHNTTYPFDFDDDIHFNLAVMDKIFHEG
tara:strand:+ start:9740 stop:10789 length:1050 start_codon:yes stop_codon:yes gene_type:complete